MMTVGGFLMYIGIRNVPFLDGLREITSGKVPTPRPSEPTEVDFNIPEFGDDSPGMPEAGKPGSGGGEDAV
jgi:hypothetical protein